jgi:1,4-dihydroxy-2-naphthoate octaprenyltransferase
MIVTFFLKLGTFFINYFGKLDTLINTLAYVCHFDISMILCINKLCQIGKDAYVYVNYHIKKQNNQQ